jgi:hypothetical protein
MLEAVGNDPGMVHAGFLAEGLRGVMFADDDGQVTGGIEENLITADPEYRFHGNGFAVAGDFRKGLFFTDAVGIPRHTRHSVRGRG